MAPSPVIRVNVKFEGGVGMLHLATIESQPTVWLDGRFAGEDAATGLSIPGLRVRIPSASLKSEPQVPHRLELVAFFTHVCAIRFFAASNNSQDFTKTVSFRAVSTTVL